MQFHLGRLPINHPQNQPLQVVKQYTILNHSGSVPARFRTVRFLYLWLYEIIQRVKSLVKFCRTRQLQIIIAFKIQSGLRI